MRVYLSPESVYCCRTPPGQLDESNGHQARLCSGRQDGGAGSLRGCLACGEERRAASQPGVPCRAVACRVVQGWSRMQCGAVPPLLFPCCARGSGDYFIGGPLAHKLQERDMPARQTTDEGIAWRAAPRCQTTKVGHAPSPD